MTLDLSPAPLVTLPERHGDVVRIFMPGIPTAKGRPRFTRAGHTYTPAKTAAAEDGLRWAAHEAMRGRPLFDEPLHVEVIARYPPPKRTRAQLAAVHADFKATKPDLDNLVKLLDALNGIVWVDDARVASFRAAKVFGMAGLTITVQPLTRACWPFSRGLMR